MPGAIFLDANANAEFMDYNSFVYGHNVTYGTMFSDIEKFKDDEFYEQHPYLYLYTPTKTYRCEIFAMYETDAMSAIYTMNTKKKEQFQTYLEIIDSLNIRNSNVQVQNDDHIITLSTCSYEQGYASNARYVLHAKLTSYKS